MAGRAIPSTGNSSDSFVSYDVEKTRSELTTDHSSVRGSGATEQQWRVRVALLAAGTSD